MGRLLTFTKDGFNAHKKWPTSAQKNWPTGCAVVCKYF